MKTAAEGAREIEEHMEEIRGVIDLRVEALADSLGLIVGRQNEASGGGLIIIHMMDEGTHRFVLGNGRYE